MKLIIEISDKMYKTVQDGTYCGSLYEELKNGIPVEPCGDCISRQAVLDLPRIKTHNVWGNVIYESVDVENVRQLPSVTPQQKMGKWFIDERPESDREVVCSNCDQPIFKYHKLDFDYRPKYCPNCGAKMYEIQTGAEGGEE